MREKSTYIVLIIILIVFFIVMFVVFGLDYIRKQNINTVIIPSDDTAWIYNKGTWSNVEKEKMDKLNWQKYAVFSDNEKVGNYLLWHDDKWYAFDDKKNAVNIEGNLFAYRSDDDIVVAKTKDINIEDNDKYIETALEDNNISSDTNFTSKYKISIDYDNDSVDEDFYVISNVFSTEEDINNVFSIVFMAKDDKIYYVYRDVNSKKGLSGCKPFLKTFLDVDNDNKYEFILGCGKYSMEKELDMLYKETDGEFKILISN